MECRNRQRAGQVGRQCRFAVEAQLGQRSACDSNESRLTQLCIRTRNDHEDVAVTQLRTPNSELQRCVDRVGCDEHPFHRRPDEVGEFAEQAQSNRCATQNHGVIHEHRVRWSIRDRNRDILHLTHERLELLFTANAITSRSPGQDAPTITLTPQVIDRNAAGEPGTRILIPDGDRTAAECCGDFAAGEVVHRGVPLSARHFERQVLNGSARHIRLSGLPRTLQRHDWPVDCSTSGSHRHRSQRCPCAIRQLHMEVRGRINALAIEEQTSDGSKPDGIGSIDVASASARHQQGCQQRCVEGKGIHAESLTVL